MNVREWIEKRVKNYSEWNNYNFSFGKYMNKSIIDVFEADPQYFKWVFLNARHRLNPEIEAFIKENHKEISQSIARQEFEEKNMFSDEVDYELKPISKNIVLENSKTHS